MPNQFATDFESLVKMYILPTMSGTKKGMCTCVWGGGGGWEGGRM